MVLKGIFSKTTFGCELCANFEVCCIILTRFRQDGGNNFAPTSKRTPKKPTQIKIKETITTMNFPNCQSFNDATEVYDDFIQKKLWLQLIR